MRGTRRCPFEHGIFTQALVSVSHPLCCSAYALVFGTGQETGDPELSLNDLITLLWRIGATQIDGFRCRSFLRNPPVFKAQMRDS